MDFITWKFQKSLNFVVSCERKPRAITKWKYHSEQHLKPVMQIMNEYDQTVFATQKRKFLAGSNGMKTIIKKQINQLLGASF